jgi:hypothetical protein
MTRHDVISWPLSPSADEVVDYDYRHLPTYVRLLSAAANGATVNDMARDIFRIDPVTQGRAARLAVRTHLSRAHWLIEQRFFPLIYWLEE